MKSTKSSPPARLPGLVYRSAKMRHLVEEISRLSLAPFPILLTGESGTGKELVARAIHALSPRRQQKFLAYNCGAVPPYLMESELFGHKKGSFTGAIADASGVIRAANHGTLLLDEVGDLLPELQPKLLRFLQEGEIHVVGEAQPRQVNVRLIAATNHNLADLVAAKKFRTDLYYRLNIAELHLPPLRERPEDIPVLIQHFLQLYGAQENKHDLSVSPKAMEVLLQHDWPGNVRELSNELHRAVALATSGSTIRRTDLSPKFHLPPPSLTLSLLPPASPALVLSPMTIPFPPEMSLREVQQQVERALILAALERQQGNKSRAAEELGWSRQTLLTKIKEYGLCREKKPPKTAQSGKKLDSWVASTPPLKSPLNASFASG